MQALCVRTCSFLFSGGRGSCRAGCSRVDPTWRCYDDSAGASPSRTTFRPASVLAIAKHALRLLLVAATINLSFAATAVGQFVLIDDFESYTVGEIDGQNNGNGSWVADPEYQVEVEPGTTNQVFSALASTNVNGYLHHTNVQLDEGASGTLFFRFQRGAAGHIIFGLTPNDQPSEFGDFEASIGNRHTHGGPGILDVRSDGGYQTVGDFSEDEWINFWMVIDNDLDELQVYARSDITFPDQVLLDDGANDTFVFRNGTLDPLTTFFVRTGRDHEEPFYIDDIFLDPNAENLTFPSPDGVQRLQAGDADQDLDFDQLDLVQVQIAAKYLSGQAATWDEGDWDGAPGGEVGSPPAGNGMFDQLDIISALAPGHYLTGPYAAIDSGGQAADGQTSVGYHVGSGEVWVDAPAGTDLTSINIDSAAGIFTGEAAQNLGGSFDNDADTNIFKATFGSSFGSLSFGNVAQPGLSRDFVLNDLTVVGSLAGGGDLGAVDLIYVPEPSTVLLLASAFAGLLAFHRCQSNRGTSS